MVPKTFNILFVLRKPRTTTNLHPIYLRITVSGLSREFSTGRKWFPDRWNQKTSRAIGTKEEAKQLNAYLDTLLQQCFEVKRAVIESGKELTPQLVLDLLVGREIVKPKTILEMFKEHNKNFAELVGKEVVKSSLSLDSRYR